MKNKVKIGEVVWVNPNDAPVSKAKIVGFQKVEPFDPIVEGITPNGTKFKNSFSPNRINKYREGKYFKEWRYI